MEFKWRQASLVVLVAVLVAIYNKPHIVFYVPKIGFLLHIAMGGTMPPWFDTYTMSHCVRKDDCPWLTSKDVVIDACGKCGTNWMLTVVHELRTWNQAKLQDFDDILEVAPWVELVEYIGQDKWHRWEHWGNKWNNTKFPFKEYKCHLPPHSPRSLSEVREILLPVRERRDVKYLVMVRNPQDALVSFTSFVTKRNPEWSRYWGSTPSWPLNVDTIVWLATEKVETYGPLHFFDSWYEYKDEPNVLLLHYTDVFKNPSKYLRMIAKFIEIDDITEEGFKNVEQRISIKFMKEHNDRYQYRTGPTKNHTMLMPDALVRKGGVENANEELSEKTRARLQKVCLEKLGPYKLKLLEDGFEAHGVAPKL